MGDENTDYPTENIHKTSMTPRIRSELIRILRMCWSFEQLSKLTDRQLHEQWLADCQYIAPQRAPLGMPDDMEFIQKCTTSNFAASGARILDL